MNSGASGTSFRRIRWQCKNKRAGFRSGVDGETLRERTKKIAAGTRVRNGSGIKLNADRAILDAGCAGAPEFPFFDPPKLPLHFRADEFRLSVGRSSGYGYVQDKPNATIRLDALRNAGRVEVVGKKYSGRGYRFTRLAFAPCIVVERMVR